MHLIWMVCSLPGNFYIKSWKDHVLNRFMNDSGVTDNMKGYQICDCAFVWGILFTRKRNRSFKLSSDKT